MANVLVVEDDPQIQTLLESFLVNAGHRVVLAGDGVKALACFHEATFDLVLLDIMLPKIDGYGVCEVIRRESSVPVIMITALDSEAHQLAGYDLLVDDYVTKPFSMRILLRKVEAVLRRTEKTAMQPNGQLRHGEILLDTAAHDVFVHGNRIDLTQKEYELLQMLLENRGRVLTRDLLVGRIWSYDFIGDARVVDTHIKNLRRKLGGDYIQTIRGVGYRIAKEN